MLAYLFRKKYQPAKFLCGRTENIYILSILFDKPSFYFLTDKTKQFKKIDSHLQPALLQGKILPQGGSIMAYRRKSSQVIVDAQERSADLRAKLIPISI
jgi:hypothetical protein